VLYIKYTDIPAKTAPKMPNNIPFFDWKVIVNTPISCICFLPLLPMIEQKNGDKRSVFQWDSDHL